MENVFESAVNAGNIETQTAETNTNSEATLGSEFELTNEDLFGEEGTTEETAENINESDSNESSIALENPTNQAFAQMRTQNKEYSEKINALDEIAKAAGLKDIDELIAKSREAQIKKQAKEQGIPESVAKEMAEFREFKSQYEQDKINAQNEARERSLVNNLQTFIDNNKLSKETVDKLSNDLEKDGFTIEALSSYPKTALDRILSSYVNLGVQKNLERKEAIKNELPISQSSKIDTNSVNKEIDKLARMFAGK